MSDVSGTGRYVRMHGFDPGNYWGFSIWEMRVYGSIDDKDLAKSAMHSCDEAMSLLLGSTTSVGTLSKVATLVNNSGTEHMPGECCMDSATNSEFFGYRVSAPVYYFLSRLFQK